MFSWIISEGDYGMVVPVPQKIKRLAVRLGPVYFATESLQEIANRTQKLTQ